MQSVGEHRKSARYKKTLFNSFIFNTITNFLIKFNDKSLCPRKSVDQEVDLFFPINWITVRWLTWLSSSGSGGTVGVWIDRFFRFWWWDRSDCFYRK